MKLLWPWLLLFLLLIPLLIGIYIWLLRRKRKYAVRYSSLSLIREAMPKRSRWRQHVPFALLLLGLSSLVMAMARPVNEIEVPLSRTSIILALDVSRSMCATDVSPNRLAVAQEAALAFIDAQAEGTQMGVVAFAGFAEVIVPPTNDKDELKTAVSNLTTAMGTAIGSATLKSIDAIAEVNGNVAPSGVDVPPAEESALALDPTFEPDIIVLLTDGANSQGIDPLSGALAAANRNVRVYTIGFGTSEMTDMVCSSQQIGSDAFNGGFGFGGGGFGGGFGGGGGDFRRYLVIDEPTLEAIATITGGEYYRAENSDQLFEVFRNLPTHIVLQKQQTEISFIFTGLAVLLTAVAVTLSLKWNRYP